MKTLDELIEELQDLAYQGRGDWVVFITAGTGGVCTPSPSYDEDREEILIS